MRIALAESDQVLRDTLAEVFAEDGHEVTCFEGAERFLEALGRGDQFDLVIANNPQRRGALRLLVRLKEIGLSSNPSVIIYSGDSNPGTRTMVERLGGTFVFKLGFCIEGLRSAVNNCKRMAA